MASSCSDIFSSSGCWGEKKRKNEGRSTVLSTVRTLLPSPPFFFCFFLTRFTVRSFPSFHAMADLVARKAGRSTARTGSGGKKARGETRRRG